MIEELAKIAGELTGEYIARFYWAEFVAFFSNFIVMGGVIWLAERFLPAWPGQEQRKGLIIALGSLLVLRLIWVGTLRGRLFAEDIAVPVTVEIVFLVAMFAWFMIRLDILPMLLCLAYALLMLALSIPVIFGSQYILIARAATAGQFLLYIGLLLWTIVGFKAHRSRCA